MAYSFQTFSLNQVLTSAQMNQVEVNIRDHKHGTGGVESTPAMKDAANEFTANQQITLSRPKLTLKETSAGACDIVFKGSDDAVKANLTYDVAAREFIFDNNSIQLAKLDNTGKWTAGTVPLARLSAADANAGYPQSGTGGETLRTLRGRITLSGGGATINLGTGFTAVRNAAGDVTVTFSTNFSGEPVATAIPTYNLGNSYEMQRVSSSVSTYQFFILQGGVGVDATFDFIITGPA